MVTPRKPNESDAEYLARLASDDDAGPHKVALALVVDGEMVDMLPLAGDRCTATIERTPSGIVAVVFAGADDGDPPWHYVRAASGGYEGAHTHVWRKVADGRPGKPARAWRLVRAVGWRPDEYQKSKWSGPGDPPEGS
ncbi:MAG: hypothetical protein JWQ83_1147 [Lacunisphaera sp.]|nr:hypothetical protein [Lacunisphaera sp.]